MTRVWTVEEIKTLILTNDNSIGALVTNKPKVFVNDFFHWCGPPKQIYDTTISNKKQKSTIYFSGSVKQKAKYKNSFPKLKTKIKNRKLKFKTKLCESFVKADF